MQQRSTNVATECTEQRAGPKTDAKAGPNFIHNKFTDRRQSSARNVRVPLLYFWGPARCTVHSVDSVEFPLCNKNVMGSNNALHWPVRALTTMLSEFLTTLNYTMNNVAQVKNSKTHSFNTTFAS